MYKIMIVDDFPADRENIRNVIESYSDMDVRIVGVCSNGLQALEMIESCYPDIIISDIEMPVCDGFELARNVRIRYPSIKIIFCSMYDEFEYAKRALYFGSYGYVLKAVDREELKQCINRATGQLFDEMRYQQDRKENEQMKSMLESIKPVLSNNLLRDIIYGASTGFEEDIWERIRFLGIKLDKGVFCLVLMEIDDFEKVTEGKSAETKQVFSLRVSGKISEILSQTVGCVLTIIDNAHFVAIFNDNPNMPPEKLSKSVHESCNRVMMNFRKSDVSLTLAESDCCRNIFSIKDLYQQCLYLLKHKFTLGKGKIILPDDIPSNKAYPDIDFNTIQKEIRFLLNSGTREEIIKYIDSLLDCTPLNAGEKYLKNLCFCVVICAQAVLNENNERFKEVFNSESLIWEKLAQFETILDAGNWIKNIIGSIHEYLCNKSVNRNRLIAEEVKKYIENNYIKNTNLEKIAADLYYSPNYLNRVFKQETGETIYDFAMRYRIEKAKEMLLEPKSKFYEVSETLGYSNPAYFSYVFKKYTGFTPKYYKGRYCK